MIGNNQFLKMSYFGNNLNQPMKPRQILSVLLTFALFVPVCVTAQRLTSDSVDVFIKTKMQQRNIPGLQLAVIRQGNIVKQNSYGLASLEHDILATDQSMFSINSITKAFVGVAIMQLTEEGKLKVDDPISMYLDSLPESWKGITVKQVLTHTSGLPDIIDAKEDVLGDGDEFKAWEAVKTLPLEFKAGEKFSYNQTGYVILGKIINKLSGMHFTKFIEDRQFRIADMKLTRFADSYDVVTNSWCLHPV